MIHICKFLLGLSHEKKFSKNLNLRASSRVQKTYDGALAVLAPISLLSVWYYQVSRNTEAATGSNSMNLDLHTNYVKSSYARYFQVSECWRVWCKSTMAVAKPSRFSKGEKKLTGLQQASPKHHHNKETFPEKIPFNKMHLIRFPI